VGRGQVELSTLKGRVPAWALLSYGYGYGSGYGSGYGDGDGSGDGYGSGYGYGYGYGYGSGYGSGDGSGDGSGSGYGSGYGSGDGSGSGYGSGYGYGSGSGYGSSQVDVERCRPEPVNVSARHLRLREACGESVELFTRTFPKGAEFPRDIAKAIDAGLDLGWARENLGLLMPITEDVPA
jgi:hypothetical protein